MKKIYFLPILLTFLTIACEKNDYSPAADTKDVNNFVYEVMKEWYLWNDSLLSDYDLSFDNPQDLVDTMTPKIDKWSFIENAASIQSYFDEGEDFGYGFYLGWDELNPSASSTLRVMFIYNNTSAYKAGVRRGWTITKMNGTSVQNISDFTEFFSSSPGSMDIKFKNNLGQTVDLSLTKETYNMNGVLSKTIFDAGGKSVGYMAFQSFLNYATRDLDEAINYFNSSGVDELIVDLRFNTGGNVSTAQKLSDILVTPSAVGAKFIEMLHNNKRKSVYDSTYYFQSNANNLGLDRVFFITNEYTASASELVINGLIPHMNVVTIGENTYGKPVAMYGFAYEDWLFYPVSAKSVNANGYGDYFKGLKPDYYIYDQFHNDWADVGDPAIAQALNIIKSVATNQTTIKSTHEAVHRQNVIDEKRLNRSFLLKDRN